jgi:hypothetical protein
MDVEQATRKLLELLDANGGSLTAAIAEADDELAQDQATASAAAHALATESGIITGQETDAREWFPYSFMTRS